jgi:hypothetical protein
MSPTFWAFLTTPIVDVAFPRRTYALGMVLAAAASLALSRPWF